MNTDTEVIENALRVETQCKESRATAMAAVEALKNEALADRDMPLREDTGVGEYIYERRVPGFHLSWVIEPAGTEDRSVMYADWRNGETSSRALPWTDGETSGRALPWTVEREAVIRAAGEHWGRI